MKRFLTSSLFPALLGVAGCTYQYYEGPKLSRSDTAEIWTYATGDTSMNLTAIDGDQNPFRRWPRKLMKASVASVLPGKYEVKLTRGPNIVEYREASWDRYRVEIVYAAALSFEAKPGYSYVFTTAGRFSIPRYHDAIACVHEELQNDPKARIESLGEIRSPGENARKLACSPVGIASIKPV